MPNSCKATVSMAEDPGLHIRSPGTRPASQQLEAKHTPLQTWKRIVGIAKA